MLSFQQSVIEVVACGPDFLPILTDSQVFYAHQGGIVDKNTVKQ